MASQSRTANAIDRFIGARIRARRLELRATQEKLACEIGVSFQQVQKYERGVNRVAASTLHQIAVSLDADIASFLPLTKTAPERADENIDAIMALARRLNTEGQKLLVEMARSLADAPRLRRR